MNHTISQTESDLAIIRQGLDKLFRGNDEIDKIETGQNMIKNINIYFDTLSQMIRKVYDILNSMSFLDRMKNDIGKIVRREDLLREDLQKIVVAINKLDERLIYLEDTGAWNRRNSKIPEGMYSGGKNRTRKSRR